MATAIYLVIDPTTGLPSVRRDAGPGFKFMAAIRLLEEAGGRE
jgi:hypothetical protein